MPQSETEFEKRERFIKIRQYFTRLNIAKKWFQDPNTDRLRDSEAIDKVNVIITQLEKLGVDKNFSTWLFGIEGEVKIDKEIGEQFR